MVKGISRRVIVVDSPDPHVFEQAIFILSTDAADNGVSSQQLVDQAVRIAQGYARSHATLPKRRIHLSPGLCAVLGALTIGVVWLTVWLI